MNRDGVTPMCGLQVGGVGRESGISGSAVGCSSMGVGMNLALLGLRSMPGRKEVLQGRG